MFNSTIYAYLQESVWETDCMHVLSIIPNNRTSIRNHCTPL